MSNEILLKNKNLIYSQYNIDSNANKLFNFILYKMQCKLPLLYSNEIVDFDKVPDVLKCEVSLEEYKEIYKKSCQITKKGSQSIIEYLMNTKIKFVKYDTNKYVVIPLIAKYEIDLNNGKFTFSILKDLYVYLRNYKKKGGFVSSNLKIERKYKSFYSQQFINLFKYNTNLADSQKTDITMTIDEIKELFLAKQKYERYNDFKKYVILTAINEINKSEAMFIEFKENKIGRAVKSITFTVKDNEPKIYDFINDKSNLKDDNLSVPGIKELKAAKINISATTLQKNFDIYGEDMFNRAINILINKKENGEKITAPVKFLTGILEKLKINGEVAITQAKSEGNKTLNFTNYSQREYDYDSLEKQLLGWDE